MFLYLVTCISHFPLTEGFADVGYSLEDAVWKIDLDLHVLHVRELQAQQLVLRREKEPGVSLDAIFVQCPVGFEQPCLLLLPPQSMVRPVLLHICKQEMAKRVFWSSLTTDKWAEIGLTSKKYLTTLHWPWSQLVCLFRREVQIWVEKAVNLVMKWESLQCLFDTASISSS